MPYFAARLDQYGTGAVAEQDAGRAVRIVDDCRHLVGADDDDFAIRAALDELRRDGERINKAGACRLHVEAADIADIGHVADQIGGRGKDEVRRGGGADQQIDIAGRGAGLLQKTAHRLGAHMRGAEPFALEDVAFLDAGALDDPFVAGVHHARQLGIGEHVGRDIAVHAGNSGPDSRLMLFGFFRHSPVDRKDNPITRGSRWQDGSMVIPRRSEQAVNSTRRREAGAAHGPFAPRLERPRRLGRSAPFSVP